VACLLTLVQQLILCQVRSPAIVQISLAHPTLPLLLPALQWMVVAGLLLAASVFLNQHYNRTAVLDWQMLLVVFLIHEVLHLLDLTSLTGELCHLLICHDPRVQLRRLIQRT